MTTLKEDTAKGLFWGAINNGTTQVLNVVIGIFLARLLTPGDYGLVGVLAIFTAIAGNLQNSGFATAVINMKTPRSDDYNAVFWFNVMMSLLLYGILWFCAPLIARYFRQPALVELSRFTFLAFVVGAFGIAHNAYLVKNMMNREIAIASVVGLVASGITGIVLALQGFRYWSLAWQQVIYIAVVNLCRYYFTFSKWHPSLHIDLRPIVPMLSFSMKILVTTIINSVSNNVLTFIFGRIFPIKTVGNFSQAYKWDTMASQFVSGTLNQIAQPVLVKVSDDADREERVFRKMTRFTAMMAFPIMLGLALVAKEFILVTISSKWIDSVPLLQILCIGGAFLPFYALYQNLAISHGRSDIYMWCNIFQIAIQVGIILLMGQLGIVAMVAAYTAFTVLWLVVWHMSCRRLSGFKFKNFVLDIVPFLLISLTVMAVTGFVTLGISNQLLLLIVRVIVAALLYCAILKVLKVQIFEECLQFAKAKLLKKGQ